MNHFLVLFSIILICTQKCICTKKMPPHCTKLRDIIGSGCLSYAEILQNCRKLEPIFKHNSTWFIAAWTANIDHQEVFDTLLTPPFEKLLAIRELPLKIQVDCNGRYREGYFIFAQFNTSLNYKIWIRTTIEQIDGWDINVVERKCENGKEYLRFQSEYFATSVEIFNGLQNVLRLKGYFKNIAYEFLLLSNENYEQRNKLIGFIINPKDLSNFSKDDIQTNLYEKFNVYLPHVYKFITEVNVNQNSISNCIHTLLVPIGLVAIIVLVVIVKIYKKRSLRRVQPH